MAYSTPPSYISDITIVTDLDGADGIVDYHNETAGTGPAQVSCTFRDATGAEVATSKGATGA